MKRIPLLSVTLLFSVFISANAVYSQSVSDYKMKIEKMNKEMAKYMVEGNSEKSLSMYTADAISLPSYEPMHEGIAAIRKANEEMMKSGWKCTSFEPTVLKVMPNGNMITEIGTYKISMTMPGNAKTMDDHGKYLTMWEKQNDGSLKIKVETWNSDVNPMDMMKSDNEMGMQPMQNMPKKK
jgi:ketosteroid isomerase-like protein